MSVKKFKFVSPGIFLNEIDNSQLPKAPEEMGPVVIGRADRGPGMVPTKVDSYAEFVETFGSPVPGGKGGDVWREGNKLGPTYGAYAAQAWLRNAGPLTFVRLLGNEHPDRTALSTRAGWATDGTFDADPASHGAAYGLFIADHTAATQATATVTVESTIDQGTDHGTANGLIGGELIFWADGSEETIQYRESTAFNYFLSLYDNPATATWAAGAWRRSPGWCGRWRSSATRWRTLAVWTLAQLCHKMKPRCEEGGRCKE